MFCTSHDCAYSAPSTRSKPDSVNACGLMLTIGCQVVVANDGKKAIDVAPEFEPELVVLDIDMPVIDGCEAAKTLRQQAWAAGTMFVAHTAATGRDIIERMKKCGFHAYFRKPTPFIHFEELVRRIRRRAAKHCAT